MKKSAKAQVMKPEYKSRVESDKKKYSRKVMKACSKGKSKDM